MKNEKMSFEKMKTVLSTILSREEMKQVMAGSETLCGFCVVDGHGAACTYDFHPCQCGGGGGLC